LSEPRCTPTTPETLRILASPPSVMLRPAASSPSPVMSWPHLRWRCRVVPVIGEGCWHSSFSFSRLLPPLTATNGLAQTTTRGV
jgi:hypothetical protein